MRILHVSPGDVPAQTPAAAALAHLPHDVAFTTDRTADLAAAPGADLVVLDATEDLSAAARISERLRAVGRPEPVLVVLTEGMMVAASPRWEVADMVLPTAGPAELEARLRLGAARGTATAHAAPAATERTSHEFGPLRVDVAGFTASVRGRQLDLTFKEFELLRRLVSDPGRAFTRAELLHDVWGYDYFGGTRTVDVHIRRLRAKLGSELDQTIHTVRNVGYRFTPRLSTADAHDPPAVPHDGAAPDTEDADD